MSRRLVLAARRRFVQIWIAIFLAGLIAAAMISRANPSLPGSEVPFGGGAGDRLLNLSMGFIITQSLYVIPVFVVRERLKISIITAGLLAGSVFAYIGLFVVLVALVRAGELTPSGLTESAMWGAPLGAGVIPLVGMLVIVQRRLRRIARRRREEQNV